MAPIVLFQLYEKCGGFLYSGVFYFFVLVFHAKSGTTNNRVFAPFRESIFQKNSTTKKIKKQFLHFFLFFCSMLYKTVFLNFCFFFQIFLSHHTKTDRNLKLHFFQDLGRSILCYLQSNRLSVFSLQ